MVRLFNKIQILRLTSQFILWSFFGLSAANAQSVAGCEHQLIFLPQMHKIDEMTGLKLNENDVLKVAESQLRVAKYLETLTTSTIVFSEQVSTEDFIWSDIEENQKKEIENLAHAVFPNGLPADITSASSQQIKILYKRGAAFVQMIRGRLGRIHRVFEDQKQADSVVTPLKTWFATNPDLTKGYPPEIAELIYSKREEFALEQVNKKFLDNPDIKSAVLIYGGNHNFNFYPDLFPTSCISVPEEFQNFWPGSFRKGPHGF